MAEDPIKKREVIPEAKTSGEGILTTEYTLPEWNLTLIHAAIIIAAVFWTYWPAVHGKFLWDDDLYISSNPLLSETGRVWKAWFQPGSFIEYYPITQTVQWFQWQLWHNDTFGYHLTNIVLHTANSLLVWYLLSKFRLRLAWIGGAIFALHPMNVESVAYISELKNTLSTGPFILTMCAWIDYEETGRSRDYFLALGLFLVTMLCKVAVAMFPLVILLYAWWRRGYLDWRVLRAIGPFFAVSCLLMIASVSLGSGYAQTHFSSPGLPPMGGFFSHLSLAGLIAVFDFSMFFLPLQHMPFYRQWSVYPFHPTQLIPWLLLAIVGVWCWRRRAKHGRHVILGLGFFFINLIPFLALTPISYMSESWVMDHLLYLPMIGLIGLVVAACEDIDLLLPATLQFSTCFLTVCLALMAIQSRAYSAVFVTPEAFWGHAIEANPQAWLAHDFLGKEVLLQGRAEEAVREFEITLKYRPDFVEARTNLGGALIQLGRVQEGIGQYREALAMEPNSPILQNLLGIALAQSGNTSEALAQFNRAIKEDPQYFQAYTNMGNTYLVMNRLPDAVACFKTALNINPLFAEAHNNLGVALNREGRISEALDEYAAAVQADPGYVDAHNNLGIILGRMGRYAEAARQFEEALQLDPNNQLALQSLAGIPQTP